MRLTGLSGWTGWFAVTSAFVLAVQTQLQPDYTQLSYDVLTLIANSTGLTVAEKPSSDSPWTGPDPNLVRIQCILFSSLAASLLASFVAILGKQWLNRYAKVDMRGSLIDRSRDRQRKIDGMSTWGFSFVMESLPLMLQIALLLLGAALSKYLFTIDKVVAAVVVGFTALGLLFYVVIVLFAILSYNCPYQTPASLIFRFIIRLFKEYRKHLETFKKRFRRSLSQMKKQLRQNHGRGFGATDWPNHFELAMAGQIDRPRMLFDEDADREGYVLDSNCIAWMFDMSMDADVTLDILRFIPEVVWHADIRTTPLKRIYDTVVDCCSPDRHVVIPKFREKAYLSAKALLHIAVQRKCMGNEVDGEVFESISRQHQTIGCEDGDPDLESTLGMIDRVFGTIHPKPIRWEKLPLSNSHRVFMGRILLYRAWESFRERDSLPVDIKEFVLNSLGEECPMVATNCLLMVGLVLGFTVGKIDRALEAMELITRFSGGVATNSYHLFQIIMRAKIPEAYSEKASRLAIRGAFGWGGVSPPVGDPQDILNFLNHHFHLTTQSHENHDEPIQISLRVLGSVQCSVMNEALKQFDPTQPSFVCGMRFAFQSAQLRNAAFFFLPLIADSTRDPIMGPKEMELWSKHWASAADGAGASNNIASDNTWKAALTVFFNMINSTRWRTYVVREKWGLLQRYISNPEDSEPLRRCLGNPELIDAIPKEGKPPARTLWLAILWLEYERLSPDVQEKLKAAMGEADLKVCLSAVESELGKTEDERLGFDSFSNDPVAVDLVKKKEDLEKTKRYLTDFR